MNNADFSDHSAAQELREITATLDESDSPWKIREDLAALKNLGLVRVSGWGRGARWELTDQ